MVYITATDATTRLAALLPSTDSTLTAWNDLEAADQTVYLSMAVEVIEELHFRGQKYDTDQDELFPRVDGDSALDYDDDSNEYIIPTEVENAICLEAVALLDFATSSDYKEILEHQEHGVQEVRISGTGVQYKFSGRGADYQGLRSKRAYNLIRPFLATEAYEI